MCESVPEKYFSQNAPAAMLAISLIFLSRSPTSIVFTGIVDDMLPDHLPFGNQKRF
jgi:hypothetical protein